MHDRRLSDDYAGLIFEQTAMNIQILLLNNSLLILKFTNKNEKLSHFQQQKKNNIMGPQKQKQKWRRSNYSKFGK